MGDRVGIATPTGVEQVRSSGLRVRQRAVAGRDGRRRPRCSSDVQRWFDRPRRGHADQRGRRRRRRAPPNSSPARIAARRAARPQVETGEATADERRRDQRRARQLPHARAARLRRRGAARRRIHHLQHLLDHRRPADAGVRAPAALGATRRQILGAVTIEALAIGVTASAARPLARASVCQGASRRCSTPPASGSPPPALALAPRTIAAALLVGILVTHLAALAPARRATRVAPVAAMHGAAHADGPHGGAGRPSSRPSWRWSAVRGLVAGLFGSAARRPAAFR